MRLISLLHRPNFVSVSPHPDPSCIFSGFLFHALSGSLRACFFYIPPGKRRAKPFFSFFFSFGLSLSSFVRSKRCSGEKTFQPRVDFRVHSHAYSRSATHWARRDRGKSNSYTFRPHRRPACSASCRSRLVTSFTHSFGLARFDLNCWR